MDSAAGIVDTRGKFAPWYQRHQRYRRQNLPPVSLIPVVNLDLQIFPRFFETVQRLGGKMIHEKTWSKKSRDTVPLKYLQLSSSILYLYRRTDAEVLAPVMETLFPSRKQEEAEDTRYSPERCTLRPCSFYPGVFFILQLQNTVVPWSASYAPK
jgi:hypothetical protein